MKARIEDGFRVVLTPETKAEQLCLNEFEQRSKIPVSDLDRILSHHLNPDFIEIERVVLLE